MTTITLSVARGLASGCVATVASDDATWTMVSDCGLVAEPTETDGAAAIGALIEAATARGPIDVIHVANPTAARCSGFAATGWEAVTAIDWWVPAALDPTHPDGAVRRMRAASSAQRSAYLAAAGGRANGAAEILLTAIAPAQEALDRLAAVAARPDGEVLRTSSGEGPTAIGRGDATVTLLATGPPALPPAAGWTRPRTGVTGLRPFDDRYVLSQREMHEAQQQLVADGEQARRADLRAMGEVVRIAQSLPLAGAVETFLDVAGLGPALQIDVLGARIVVLGEHGSADVVRGAALPAIDADVVLGGVGPPSGGAAVWVQAGITSPQAVHVLRPDHAALATTASMFEVQVAARRSAGRTGP